MQIFCDMDRVLVRQTGSDGFEAMPWMNDGRLLWDFIAPLGPTILSMLRDDNYERCAPQKRTWCARELGAHVPVIIAQRHLGKGTHASPGAVLIDDDERRHQASWIQHGGVFLHHLCAEESIRRLKAMGIR